jgi:catechol 2,3-dioxygenase-like lactoylglutathione lyase family enzyme
VEPWKNKINLKVINNMLNYAIPILASLNEEETVKFYTEKLGFIFHSNWDGYLIFSRDGVNIHLWPCDNEDIAKSTGCYVNVTEVDKLYAEYKAFSLIHPNGDLQEMPWKMKQFSILDNNGNLIHFGEPMEGN